MESVFGPGIMPGGLAEGYLNKSLNQMVTMPTRPMTPQGQQPVVPYGSLVDVPDRYRGGMQRGDQIYAPMPQQVDGEWVMTDYDAMDSGPMQRAFLRYRPATEEDFKQMPPIKAPDNGGVQLLAANGTPQATGQAMPQNDFGPRLFVRDLPEYPMIPANGKPPITDLLTRLAMGEVAGINSPGATPGPPEPIAPGRQAAPGSFPQPVGPTAVPSGPLLPPVHRELTGAPSINGLPSNAPAMPPMPSANDYGSMPPLFAQRNPDLAGVPSQPDVGPISRQLLDMMGESVPGAGAVPSASQAGFNDPFYSNLNQYQKEAVDSMHETAAELRGDLGMTRGDMRQGRPTEQGMGYRDGKWYIRDANTNADSPEYLATMKEGIRNRQQARNDRYQNFLDERKQDAELRGLPPLTRFIAKQMGGEGGLDPLLLATADPRLGQMAAGMQQAQAGNQLQRDLASDGNALQRDLAEKQRDSQREIAQLGQQGYILKSISEYLSQLGVTPSVALPLFAQMMTGLGGAANSNPAANVATPDATTSAPPSQPSTPLSDALTQIGNSPAGLSSGLAPTATVADAVNLVASRPDLFDLNTPQGLQKARAFLMERGYGREQLNQLRKDNTPTAFGDVGRDWREVFDTEAWSNWLEGNSVPTEAEKDRAEYVRMSELAAKLM